MMIWQGLFPSHDRWVYRLALRFSALKCVNVTGERRGREKTEDGTLRSRQSSMRKVFSSCTCENKKRRSGQGWSGVSLLFLLEGQLRIWYWDVLLFYRRALLQLVFVFVPVGVTQQSLFVVLQLLFLILHVHQSPYSSRLATYTETVSYAILLLVNMLNFPSVGFSSVTLPDTVQRRTFLQSLARVQSVLAFIALLGLGVVMGGVYGLKLFALFRSFQKKEKGSERGYRCCAMCPCSSFLRVLHREKRRKRNSSHHDLAVPLIDLENGAKCEEKTGEKT
uniref:Uncharacterized protein n=1 Tax=Palpitomonas bilix TaxID=652834 RepID=A0A7S3G957_9EUKA|mmetsp:Transcript_29819/g.76977  ORF Transcript_29819/g.76977 Transcript_29819/m.76977 type:complete len:279 (+) Transcript_29819:3-839(+)